MFATVRSRRFGILAAAALALAASSSVADLLPATGYHSETVFDTAGQFTLIEALDVVNGQAYIGYGTNLVAVTLTNHASVSAGHLPENVTVAYVKLISNVIHAAFGQSFAFPFPSRYGIVSGGTFSDQGGTDGIYDAAIDGNNTLYVMANPGGAGSRVYRYEPASTTLTEVINIGGFSGPIAFDSSNRLYVAEQSYGDEKILRFTQAQLTLGGLSADDGEATVDIGATYMCFDERDRLYVTSEYGNRLSVFDVESGALIREVGVDATAGYGIGRIAWDRRSKRLVVVHSDFGTFDSTLQALGYYASSNGIPGTSSVFQAWISSYQNYTRPETNSGGYARDDLGDFASPGAAVIGRPEAFDPDDGTTHVLSLGNGGSITVTFPDAVVNGPGADFAVFENGLYFGGATFAELAFVEVATTTNAWARFPVTSFNTNAVPPFGIMDVTRVDGVAGKHTLPYGTPFDLAWLASDTNVLNGTVDLNRIVYIRLTDVVGDGSRVDADGYPIFDPYSPTPSITDGFDLRGVGVIHLAGLSIPSDGPSASMDVFGHAGHTYRLEASDDGSAWSFTGDAFVGTGGVQRVLLPTGGDNAKLFRVTQDIPFTP